MFTRGVLSVTEYALSTNLYTFAQAAQGFIEWPASSGEGELIRSLELGDVLLPKFAQAPRYGFADDLQRSAAQQTYCEDIGLDYQEILDQYTSTIGGGTNVVPFYMRVTGTPQNQAATPNRPAQIRVGVAKTEITGPISTQQFLRLRVIPEEIAVQFKAVVSPGRHIQELPPGTVEAVVAAADSGDIEEHLRKYSLVNAETIHEAEELLREGGRPVRKGDRVFIAAHAALLGVHEVNVEDHLIAVGTVIPRTPSELLELFRDAERKIIDSDSFTPKGGIAAANQLSELLTGPTRIIAVDDFGRFHDRFEILARKVTQALEIIRRPLPDTPIEIAPDREEATEDELDTEVDELTAVEGLTIDAVRLHLPVDMVIANSVLAEAVTALRSGKHLLLGGPPGTGKSTLAIALCNAVVDRQFDVATATADWTTFDTIGGYIPQRDGGLHFEPGVVLRALKRGRWLVIDELNRADIDKAFGPLFTLLSTTGGNAATSRVVLPYLEDGKQLEVRWANKRSDAGQSDFIVTPSWRLIGTLNLSDKATLFQLSFAFLRRFAVIEVPLPSESEYRTFFRSRFSESESETLDRITNAAIALAFGERQLGPAILEDIATFISKGVTETASGQPAYESPITAFITAVRLFAVPQYEGATPSQTRSVITTIRETIDVIDEGAMVLLDQALKSVEMS